MEARFEIQLEDLKAFRKYAAKNPSRAQWPGCMILFAICFAHFVVFPGAVLLYFGTNAEVWLAFALILLGQTAIWVGFYVTLLYRAFNKPLRQGHDKNNTLTICTDWLRVANPLSESTHRWTDIDKIAVTENHAFFFIDADRAFVVPRRAFADAGKWFDFLHTARRFFEGAKADGDNPSKEST
jgi:hypothetical protein